MNNYYTNERNIQIIISLLKKHNIKKVIASPGTTHISFLGSIQSDPYFEIYSSIDERSAAYMACGLAAESGEPVVITCTGATASRNYIPAITEAYYRKLPIVALTGTQHISRVGQNVAQVIDRSVQINDTYKYVTHIPMVHTQEDEEMCCIEVNNALLELSHNGSGPVLINFESSYSNDFSVKELPPVHFIDRITYEDKLPEINFENVGIYVGAHLEWSDELTKEVDKFCEKYNGVVICDQTSNYKGKYGISGALIRTQNQCALCERVDLLIDLGDVSGAYYDVGSKYAWRVSKDGMIKQRFSKLNYVFEMSELFFFKEYNKMPSNKKMTLYNEWKTQDLEVRKLIPELPFSNIWIAQNIYEKVPKDAVIYLGILNTLRSWNFVPLLQNNLVFSNTGGFGIDGNLSSTIGASLANKNRLHFLFVGDLAFFYDMNSIGNRAIDNNLRIMLINNGRGTEFRNFNHRAQKTFGDEADDFMAAAGHFGNQSEMLVKNYSENLGFKYICASNKEEFNEVVEEFLSPKENDKPIIFEVFTNHIDESNAYERMTKLKKDTTEMAKRQIKTKIKNVLGDKTVNMIKSKLKR